MDTHHGRAMTRSFLLMVLVLLTGCPTDRNGDGKVIIACVGDSNTMARWPFTTDSTTRWCERLAAKYPGWTFKNYGMLGASTHEVTPGGFPPQTDGTVQLAAAVADHADLIVMAFTTNDVRVWGRSAADVVAGYQALHAMVPAGIPIGIIAPPPCEPGYQAAMDAADTAVRAQWPDRVIAPAVPAGGMAADGVHLNDIGQAARASAVDAWIVGH